MHPFIQVTPIACKALHSRLEYLLKRYTSPMLSSLSFSTIDDFLVRGLYILPQPPSYPENLKSGIIPVEELKNIYGSDSADSVEWFVASHKKDVHVPRWICSRASEIFFEGDRKGVLPDSDEIGLATSLISCLMRLPKDVRAKVMQAVVVVGGGAAIPGLRTRLQKSFESAWTEKVPKPMSLRSTTPEGTPPGSPTVEPVLEAPLSIAELSQKNSFPFRFVATNPLEATYRGASLLGDIKVRGLVEVSREGFNSSHGRSVKDWSYVGGLGDEGVEESKRRSRG